MRTLQIVALAALAAATPALAAPGDMNADAFFSKAQALKSKGPLALMSGDLKPLQAEIQAASQRVRAENLAAKKRGKAIYCPPAKGSAGVDFVIDGLAAIPEGRRKQITLTQAWREIMVRKFPCS